MTIDEREETLPTERTGMVVYVLMENRGQKFTTAYFANLTGLQHNSVWTMLSKLSRVLPISRDMDGWYIE